MTENINVDTNCEDNSDEEIILNPWEFIKKDFFVKDCRICTRNNFVPMRYIQYKPDRSEWHDAYILNLIDMYKIIQTNIESEFPKINFTKTRNEIWFHNFSKMIYSKSSGVIMDT